MEKYKFIKKNTFYSTTVWEWNLPSGHSCPFAVDCLVKVDRNTGTFNNKSKLFRCYAASSERFPSVRKHRWSNYDYVVNGGVPKLPKNCNAIRIHASGDFFNQQYFDMWVSIAKLNKDVEFWAFTKSINYWVCRINDIPKNLILTASYGGVHDNLISEYGLKSAKVYSSIGEIPNNLPIDTNDDYARMSNISFALLDNNKKHNKRLQTKLF